MNGKDRDLPTERERIKEHLRNMTPEQIERNVAAMTDNKKTDVPKVKHSITIEKASQRVGDGVIYQSHAGANRERGVITSVRHPYVFVRFDGDEGSKAVPPERLFFEFRVR